MAITLSTILTLAAAYYWPIQETCHPLNVEWNGCSKLVALAERSKFIDSVGSLTGEDSGVLFINGPVLKISDQESLAIREYLEHGGIGVLADNFGSGNSLLQGLDIGVSFAGKPLVDLYQYGLDPSFPIIADFAPSPITASLTTIILNHPTYLEFANRTLAVPLAHSSPFSFVDVDGDNVPATNETLDRYPVMAAVNIGDGLIITISDSGLFVNQMIDMRDNMKLFKNIIALAKGFVLFDVSHVPKAPLDGWRVWFRGEVDVLIGVVATYQRNAGVQAFVTGGVLLAFTIAILRRLRRPVNESTI